jgi:DNA polymerase-3 subunit epsilon
MALLLECTEIKKYGLFTPLKRFEPKFGLFEYEARNGYRYLAVGKLAKIKVVLKLLILFMAVLIYCKIIKQI